MAIGEKLIKLREQQGLSQKELAQKLGVSTGIVAEWESEEATPSIADIAKICSAFSISTDCLIMENRERMNVNPSCISESAKEPSNLPKDTSLKRKTSTNRRLLIVLAVGAIALIYIVGMLVCPALLPSAPADSTTSNPLPFSQDTSAIEKADSSVVMIHCYDHTGAASGSGSGFIAFDDQTVVTNYHVMEVAHSCKISTNQDIYYDVISIICYSEEEDIAILRLGQSTGLTPLIFGDSTVVKKGETVVAIGSPLGLNNTVSHGVLSARTTENNMYILQFTAAISSGSSGGALFNDAGEVIGVTYASYAEGQNLNLAIPIETVSALYPTSNRQEKAVSDIYFIAHPYYKYFGEVEDVTFEQLKNNPKKYNGKTIRLEGYVSSTSIFANVSINFLVTNDLSYVSGDYEKEFDLFKEGDVTVPYTKIPYIMSDIWTEDFPNIRFSTRDKVVLIGEFNYNEKGTPQEGAPGFYYDCPNTTASILLKKIYLLTE